MKTIALYDDDSFATEFSAEVIFCEKLEDGYKVVLDKTLFFQSRVVRPVM
ncbi:hypothetical protein CIY_04310 [Butyrivibrio fibrisolvens 16/4]|nr:hypothetical protein CIY_04310 [Butyrivibrio fibrisolvens 16/4]